MQNRTGAMFQRPTFRPFMQNNPNAFAPPPPRYMAGPQFRFNRSAGQPANVRCYGCGQNHYFRVCPHRQRRFPANQMQQRVNMVEARTTPQHKEQEDGCEGSPELGQVPAEQDGVAPDGWAGNEEGIDLQYPDAFEYYDNANNYEGFEYIEDYGWSGDPYLDHSL